MKKLDLVIRNATGLHARPAKTFVKLAKKYKSDIRILNGEKKANAKSMIAVLALGVGPGATVQVTVDGADEEEAAAALAEAVRSGLGETDHLLPDRPVTAAPPTPEPTPAPAPTPAPVPAKDGELRGTGAAPGIAVGPTFRLQQRAITLDESFVDQAHEQNRLQEALAAAGRQLAALRAEVGQQMAEEAEIFDVHLELLEDEDLLDAVAEKISASTSAGYAWRDIIGARSAAMAALDNALLAARAADLRDVGDRVLRLLVGQEAAGPALPDHPVIVLAEDLTPSDTVALDPERVLGFCTAAGGPTSHSAIIARALGLPAVVSAGAALLEVADGTQLILNGHTGGLTLDPSTDQLARARAQQEQEKAFRAAAVAQAGEPVVTRDGVTLEVAANIGDVAGARAAYEAGAEGIGLLRTEFLFLDRQTAPTEDEQFAVYRDIAEALHNRPVIVRTLDIGGDKPLPYIDVEHEDNPFLGERGLRLCLARPQLFREQLRAILRAASHGRLRIMFPMVADIGEWRAARQIVEETRQELNAPPVEMGIMIEVPSAALTAHAFAPEVDFFSVGTNDLTQYALAVDRLHPRLSHLSDGLHPAVLHLIGRTADAARKAGKWVGICGALGADPQAIPILAGLGVFEFSVAVPSVATTKAIIRSLNMTEARALAQRALTLGSAAEVRALVETPFSA